jgi:hypothetical protein
MKYLLLLLVFCAGAPLPSASAQQAPAAPTPLPMYGAARIQLLGSYCRLSLSEGVQPTAEYEYVQENGKVRRFADEAFALNYLYSLGWDVLPHAIEESRHYYLLKRCTL